MPWIPNSYLAVTPPPIAGDLQESGPLITPKPGFIPAPKVAKVLLQFVCNEQVAENVLYFWQTSGNWTSSELSGLCTAVRTEAIANLVPIWNASTGYTGVVATDASSNTGPRVEVIEPTIIMGTRAGAAANMDDCVGISIHTGLQGKSQNGRIFGCGTLSSDFVLGVPDDTARTLYINAWQAFLNAVCTDRGCTFALVSYQGNRKWRTVAQVTTVAFLQVGAWIYTMRRRLPGHNRHR